MKEIYLDIMEKALSAYTVEHIKRYFDEVKRDGLTEHGFPRLTADIGILISHSRCEELMPLFLEMMDFCTYSIPRVKAANDFSVREIVSCIREAQSSGKFRSCDIARWRRELDSIKPETCYNVYATKASDEVKNWALFTGVSEYFRYSDGLSADMNFIELQLESQLKWLDENGMYMDKVGDDMHQPIAYDAAPRGLFVMLLNDGYRGKHYEAIDESLRKAGLCTLKMQSPNGEMAFGGRSNQFIHNEPWLACICEYEARRYAREGNTELVRAFKAAAKRACDVSLDWLSREPIYHIKNRFPTESGYGCEKYAYFDKYMITVASLAHAAYLAADDSIPEYTEEDTKPVAWESSYHFHKLFLKAGGYGCQFELDGDDHYDATGLGRVHKAGAPMAICMSLPCPKNPNYNVGEGENYALSIAPGACNLGEWIFAYDEGVGFSVVSKNEHENSANATLSLQIGDKTEVISDYTVSESGVEIKVRGEGKVGLMLPAFAFDGECRTEIVNEKRILRIIYSGYECRYITDADIVGPQFTAKNRSGYYDAYRCEGDGEVNVKIEIVKLG